MSLIIASHNNGASARALAERLGCRLVSHSSTKALPKSITKVINFGCSPDHPAIQRAERSSLTVLNVPVIVAAASSKHDTFRRFDEQGFRFAVPHWFDQTQANYECLVNGKTIVARTLDRSSSGRGIEVITPERAAEMNGLPQARVYTEAIDKGREYRVHVGYQQTQREYRIIDITRKIRRPDAEGERGFIWNHDNDFIFVREGVTAATIPRRLRDAAMAAVNSLGLHFGAVDIVVPRRGRISIQDMPVYVLEVNTAPGMEGTTLERYAEFFESNMNGTLFSNWAATVEGAPSNEDDSEV